MSRSINAVTAALVAWLACAHAVAAPPGLEEKLQSLRAGVLEEVAFREERHSDVLTKPAVFEGRLTYDAEANVMSKLVEAPVPVSMTVDERYVTVTRDDKTRRLKLSKRPELRALLAGFRGLLTGDTDALEENFHLEFGDLDFGELDPSGSDATWRLTMTPRSRRLKKHVDALLVDGNEQRVTAICTQMTNGDWQHMTFVAPPDTGQSPSD
ncbi:MAG: LolA-related protein [Pseudomonadota bacterium]